MSKCKHVAVYRYLSAVLKGAFDCLVVLFLMQPKSAEHILDALDSGNRNRTQHPTDMNATSSRSHAVFQVFQFSFLGNPHG